MKKSLLELATKSRVYGVSNLIRSKYLIQKIIWILFLVISASLAIRNTLEHVKSYLDYKVITVVKTEYEQPSLFPVVSFCNFKNTTKKLSDLIQKCSFGYDEKVNFNLENNFQSFFTKEFGQCYRFNSGKNLTDHSIPFRYSTIGGIDDSLSITFNSNSGIAIWVHNHTTPPKLSTYDNHYRSRLLALPNMYSQIAIDKRVFRQLGMPYNECYKNVNEFTLNKTIIDYIINKLGESYNQIKCLELCFDIFYLRSNPCNCSNATLGNVWERCWIDQEKALFSTCTWNFKVDFYTRNIINECGRFCPLECNSTVYEFETTSINDQNKTRFRIFYRSLKYTLITEQEKCSFLDLITYVSGVLSLFIGVSLASLFEMIELISEVIYFFLISINKLKS